MNNHAGKPGRSQRRACLTLACLIPLFSTLAGCSSSPPIRYHTLVLPPATTAPDRATPALQVENVTVPPQVNRSELVIREGQSSLMILEADWWGAPLPEEIRSALASQWSQGGASSNPIQVWIDVTRFDAIPSDHAWLEAGVRLIARSESSQVTIMTCPIQRQTATGQDITSIVLAHQSNIQALAMAISNLARRLQSGQTTCPP